MPTYLEKLLIFNDELHKEHQYGGNLIIEINPHLSCYETPEQKIESNSRFYKQIEDEASDEEDNIIKKCNELNKLVTIQLYPSSPGGFINLFDSNIEDAARRMLEFMEA